MAETPSRISDFLTLQDAAQQLGIDRGRMRVLAGRHGLPIFLDPTDGRRRLFRRDDLNRLQRQLAEPDTPSDVWVDANIARERTERKQEATAQLWLDGIDFISQNLQAIRGQAFRMPERDTVLVALLIHAANNQIAGYQTAVTGFCNASLALVRPCIEDWASWWYVRNFPDEAERFLNFNAKETPRWNDMIQRIKAKHGPDLTEPVERWIKWAHKLAHVDRLSVRRTYDVQGRVSRMRLGPHYDAKMFEDTASEFMQVLPPLIEASILTCRIMDREPPYPAAVDEYNECLLTWISARAESEGASATSQRDETSEEERTASYPLTR